MFKPGRKIRGKSVSHVLIRPEEESTMSRNKRVFKVVAKNLAHIDEVRKTAMGEAFAVLEQHDHELADILVLQLGDRKRAVSWMCASQRVLEGRTAYETLAEGDVDTLWDILADAIS
jgi:hypothetical protein